MFLWAIFHLAALDFACACTPVAFPDWPADSRVIGAVLAGVPLLAADWFVWTKWASTGERQGGPPHIEEHLPDYARRKGYM